MSYTAATARRIVEVLKACQALDCEYQHIDPTLAVMRRRGEIVVLGTAREAGYTGINSHAPVYGLPGMTLARAPAKAQRTSSGSGQIAGKIVVGRGLKWGAHGGPW